MPFTQSLPEWNAAGEQPPQSKLDAGWGVGERPPAGWWNYLLNRTYLTLLELQRDAIHKDQKGVAGGVASLGTDGKIPSAQLPSAAIPDGSVTNAKLANDVKVGSLATLKTGAKASVTAAVNEVKDGVDTKLNASDKGVPGGVATLGSDGKVPTTQLPTFSGSQITNGTLTNDKLSSDVKVGSLATLKTTQKTNVTAALNEVHDDLDNHAGDTTKHITAAEREKWDGMMPRSGGTFTGPAVAQSNTNYTTAQLRNVILSPNDADVTLMKDGEVWMKYK